MRRLAPLFVALLTAGPALAQDTVVVREGSLTLEVFLATLVYGSVGVLMCVLGFFAFDKIAGLSLKHELVEDQNVAVGIMLAGAFVGIGLVVAAVMIS
ncbi:MAG: DUF350 domain-containing protein [Bacteroidota bacterium]